MMVALQLRGKSAALLVKQNCLIWTLLHGEPPVARPQAIPNRRSSTFHHSAAVNGNIWNREVRCCSVLLLFRICRVKNIRLYTKRTIVALLIHFWNWLWWHDFCSWWIAGSKRWRHHGCSVCNQLKAYEIERIPYSDQIRPQPRERTQFPEIPAENRRFFNKTVTYRGDCNLPRV
jgi:hypothetical protein